MSGLDRTIVQTARSAAENERFATIAQRLADQLAVAEERALRSERERDDLRHALAETHFATMRDEVNYWKTNSAMRHDAAALKRARTYVARVEPLFAEMRELIRGMESSKFWSLRNSWFRIKRKAGLSAAGPQPPYVGPEISLDAIVPEDPYDAWLEQNALRPADVDRLTTVAEILHYRPTISVIMPVYNPPERYLREAIESVMTQIYPHWELCIADDASTRKHVRLVLNEYASKDVRIKVVHRPENGHISRASNSALELATGDFVALLDHDDVLAADALFQVAVVLNKQRDADMIYSDEDKVDDEGIRSSPFFKPDWSPDTLLSKMYTGHLTTYRKRLVEEVGGFRTGFEGSQDYDLALRISERTDKIVHLPLVLYHWRIHEESVASGVQVKTYAYDAAKKALTEALARRDEPGTVSQLAKYPGNYSVRYTIREHKRVSIVMPTRDHGDDVDVCLRSIFAKSTYPDFEVVLVDNGSRDPRSLRTFEAWRAREPDRFRVVPLDIPFNYSKLNNGGAHAAAGDYLLFLNNDTEIVSADWIEGMVEQAQRPSIGAVGALLLYADDTIQHAGVITRIGGVAGHSHRFFPADAPGYYHVLHTVTNYSAVTAACLMVRRDVFEKVGGFDETLAVAFNDVDFCLKIREAGFNNIYLPHVVLYHFESKSRGLDDTPAKLKRSIGEQSIMQQRWNIAKVDDPFYSPHLRLIREDYSIRV